METNERRWHFFAVLSRMRYIERWSLMRSSRPETLSEHSLEVACIAHMLCVIGNRRFGKSLDSSYAALLGIYHDAPEIITGDLPTPVKYFSKPTRTAYAEVEEAATQQLLSCLPEDLRLDFEPLLRGATPDDYLAKLVHAADKISALIKCIEERSSGNAEFRSAEKTIRQTVDAMAEELPEVDIFVREFLGAYGATLDELLAEDGSA
ncbi:MAG: 5'-deoxynucleotidase [Atopobiaceae bacterium]|jgi:5'-deoxynucleotidase